VPACDAGTDESRHGKGHAVNPAADALWMVQRGQQKDQTEGNKCKPLEDTQRAGIQILIKLEKIGKTQQAGTYEKPAGIEPAARQFEFRFHNQVKSAGGGDSEAVMLLYCRVAIIRACVNYCQPMTS